MGIVAEDLVWAKEKAPKKLWDEFRAWKKGQSDENQIYLLAPMLREVGVNRKGHKIFNCKHQLANGNCSIYVERPDLCRDLGTVNTCHHPFCGLNKNNRTLLRRVYIKAVDILLRIFGK